MKILLQKVFVLLIEMSSTEKMSSVFQKTVMGDTYPPNRLYVMPWWTEGTFMPFSQYRFPPFRPYFAGPYIKGARQAVIAHGVVPQRVYTSVPPLPGW